MLNTTYRISSLIEGLNRIKDKEGDLPVLVDGYERGYENITIHQTTVHESNTEYSFLGAFEDFDDADRVVILSREERY